MCPTAVETNVKMLNVSKQVQNKLERRDFDSPSTIKPRDFLPATIMRNVLVEVLSQIGLAINIVPVVVVRNFLLSEIAVATFVSDYKIKHR